MINVQSNNNASTSSTPKGVQFLSPRHVPQGGDLTCQITRVSTPDNGGSPDNFGNPYIVFYACGANKYSKGYKPTSDALSALVTLFGNDESKWVGKTVVISKSTDDDGGERLTYGAPAPAKGKGK